MWPRADPRCQCESGVSTARGQSFLERLWRPGARRRAKLESEQMSRECTVTLKSRRKCVSDDDKGGREGGAGRNRVRGKERNMLPETVLSNPRRRAASPT